MDHATVTRGREGVTEDAVREGQAKRVPAGSLILSFKLSLGKVAITDRDVYPNEAIAWLRPGPGVEQKFLALALQGTDWDRLGGRAVKGKTLNSASLDAIPLVLPPLTEQLRIVDLIGALDDAIDAAERSLATVRNLSSEFFRSQRDERVREPWGEVVIADIADVIGGGTPKASDPRFWGGEIQWLTPKDLADRPSKYTASGARSITRLGLSGSGARLLPAGAVLLTSRAPVGYVSIAGGPIATNQGFKSLVLKEGQNSEFWYYLLRESVDYLRDHAGGSTFQEISGGVLKTLKFSVPSFGEQRHVAGVMAAMEEACDALVADVSSFRALRRNLLIALLSGEHAIPDSYDDVLEVAS